MFDDIETPRLRLRRLASGDLSALLGYRNDPEVARYQSWEGCTPEEGAAFIAEQARREPGAPNLWFQFAVTVRPENVLVGDCGLCVDADGTAEIGFTLSRAAQGRGFATEAVAAVIRYAFSELQVRRIVAIADSRNAEALRVLERVGLRREDSETRRTWFKNTWCEEHVFALTASRWRESARV